MKRLYWLLIPVFMFSHTQVHGMLAPGAYRFSSLLPGSDLVVKGEVINLSKRPGEYRISFQVNAFLLGTAPAQMLKISVPLARNSYLRIPHEPYLEKGTYLLCLVRDAQTNTWHITNAQAGVLHIDSEDDVKHIIAQFQFNQNLFSDSQALQTLFNASRHWDTQGRLLQDLEPVLSAQDRSFLDALLTSDNKKCQSFAALQAGHLKIAALQGKILNLIETTSSNTVKAHCIIALGDIGDKQAVPTILNYADSPDASIRPAALEAVGKIGGPEAVNALVSRYLKEPSKHDRLIIIDGISREEGTELCRNAFAKIQPFESDPFLKRILSKRLNGE